MKLIILLFILLFSFLINGNEQIKLIFGVYPSDKASVMYKTFTPIIKYFETELEKKLNQKVSVKLKIFKNYQNGINSISNGEVDFVRFGPSSYILAKEKNPKIELIAMESKKGKKKFKGMIIIPKNSKIEKLIDLKGKSFAFGNKNSTIGRYLVQAELVKSGIFAKNLKNYKYLNRHDKVAKSVSLEDFDAGSVKNKTYKKFSKNNEIKVLKTFENVTKPWIVKENLNKKIKLSLKKILLNLNDKSILKELKISGFLETSDKEYNFVRKGMKIAKKFFDK